MANQYACPTIQLKVEPGDETGFYHVTFCNLPFKATWQEVKDWLSDSCSVGFVDIFPGSCSGWVCVEGKENFEAILAHIKAKCFKGRYLVFSDKNKSEPDTIRLRLAGPKPGYLENYLGFVGRSQDWTIPAMYGGPQMQQHGSYPNKLLKVSNEATDSPPTVETMALTDLLATYILVCMAAACEPPPAPYYLPTLTVPGDEWIRFHDMSPCAPCALPDDTIWMPPSPSELVLPDSAAGDGGDNDDKNDQCYLGEIPGNVRERRAHSVPPSFRWK